MTNFSSHANISRATYLRVMKKFSSICYYHRARSKRASICTIHCVPPSFSNMSAKKKDVVDRANATKDYRAKFIRSGKITEDEAFLRASLYQCLYICGSSYTATNQSNRNNCHVLATQKMHYNASRNVHAISIGRREFMADRDRIRFGSKLIFTRTTESNWRYG